MLTIADKTEPHFKSYFCLIAFYGAKGATDSFVWHKDDK